MLVSIKIIAYNKYSNIYIYINIHIRMGFKDRELGRIAI